MKNLPIFIVLFIIIFLIGVTLYVNKKSDDIAVPPDSREIQKKVEKEKEVFINNPNAKM